MFHYSFIDGIESLFILYSPLSDSDDEDNEVIYNPKNLPLGWDGKPIPYWLYKLHGLNISYSCEICGNQVCYDLSWFERVSAEVTWWFLNFVNSLLLYLISDVTFIPPSSPPNIFLFSCNIHFHIPSFPPPVPYSFSNTLPFLILYIPSIFVNFSLSSPARHTAAQKRSSVTLPSGATLTECVAWVFPTRLISPTSPPSKTPSPFGRSSRTTKSRRDGNQSRKRSLKTV